MPSAEYSKAVLLGLRKRGFSPVDVANMTERPPQFIASVLKEVSTFSDQDLARIEHAADMTAGQLALLAHKKVDESIRAVMDAWAEVLDSNQPSTRVH